MIETPRTEDWFVWGMHCTESPHSPGGWHLVVELPAVKEMIGLVAQGRVTAPELHQALDAFARRFHTADDPDVTFDDGVIGEDCPYGCTVCAGARPEFDAIAVESFTHKVRLADPDRHPYAAGKNTLHRSYCPKVARFVGRAEPVGSPWCLAGLPAFAHHGVCSTSWAAGMQVMTVEEAADWVGLRAATPDGTGYKTCCHCLPPVPESGPAATNGAGVQMGSVQFQVSGQGQVPSQVPSQVPGQTQGTGTNGYGGVFDAGYWNTESAVTWV